MIRVFPRKTSMTPTDKLAFIGDPPLIGRPPQQPVMVSCTFTWDINEAERLYRAWSKFYDDVQLGGPAFGDPGDEFTPGLFLKEGVTITSRGCPKDCQWCHVPKREKQLRLLDIKPGHIVQDNNLLACPDDHLKKVFEMLRDQRAIEFPGGLDAELMTEKHAALLRTVSIKQMWFACDYPGAELNLKKIRPLMRDFPRYKKRCYVMVGFNGETIRQAQKRLERVWQLGFMPFCIPYQSDALDKNKYGSEDWRRMIKTWSRPAAMKAAHRIKSTEDLLFN